MQAKEPYIVMASGQGISILALTSTDPAQEFIPRIVPECDMIASRPLRPGEAQFLQRVIREIVR